MTRLPHLSASLHRQCTPGSLALLACAMILFGPRLVDHVLGEPWIDNELTVVVASTGGVAIEDIVTTTKTVRGLRSNSVEGQDGSILCSTEHHNSWLGSRKRFWSFRAFSGCNQPGEPYKVCSRFSISSKSGRFQQYGPFCSKVTAPVR